MLSKSVEWPCLAHRSMLRLMNGKLTKHHNNVIITAYLEANICGGQLQARPLWVLDLSQQGHFTACHISNIWTINFQLNNFFILADMGRYLI